MRKLDGEQVLLRIFIGESDKYQNKPAYQVLVELLRREKMAGATVLRGILGFGASSHMHTAHILRLSQDLPVVIEAVDSQEHIDRVMPQIEGVIGDGLITVEKVRVLRYTAEDTEG
jgi:PII-like signaling protein